MILNRLKGIEVNETADAWHLHVGAGENWHQLVRYALDNNMPGLENLALILAALVPRLYRILARMA